MARRKNRILRSLTINEISGVDKAAQVPAEALLMKRDDVEKFNPNHDEKGLFSSGGSGGGKSSNASLGRMHNEANRNAARIADLTGKPKGEHQREIGQLQQRNRELKTLIEHERSKGAGQVVHVASYGRKGSGDGFRREFSTSGARDNHSRRVAAHPDYQPNTLSHTSYTKNEGDEAINKMFVDLEKNMFGSDVDDMARPIMTTENEGHQHVFDDAGLAGETTCAMSPGEQYGHMHSWVRGLDNMVVLAATDGHTHEPLSTTKSATGGEEDTMTEQKNEAAAIAEAAQKSLNEMTKRAERAEAITKLNSEERSLFDTLGADADAFLAKTVEERAALVKGSKDSNRVVFKALDGTEYRASDDSRLIALAKKADADSKATAEAIAKAERIGLEKRANEEIAHIPGTVEVRAGILKALEGVAGAPEFLKAAEAALAKAFVSQGTSTGADLSKAEDKLETMAKAYAEANKCSIEKAHAEVMQTPEGAKLYAEMDAQKAPAPVA